MYKDFRQISVNNRLKMSNSKSSENISQATIDKLINLYNENKLSETISLGTSLTRQFPNAQVLYEVTGAANLGLELFEEAIKSYQKLLQLNPKHIDAYNNLGMAFYEQCNFSDAAENYQKAVNIEPSFADGHFNLGNALKRMGDLRKAIESYRMCLAINPNDVEVLSEYGGALKDHGNLEKACECYGQVLKIRPDDADANWQKGSILVKLNKAQNSLPYFEKAVAVNPKETVYWLSFIKTLFQLGNHKLAMDVINRSEDTGISGASLENIKSDINKYLSLQEENGSLQKLFKSDPNDKNALHCFYDLAVSPCSYDFFTYLYSAEICRVRRNLKEIKLFIVHGPNNKFKNDHRSRIRQETFFHNVITPGISLLPSISSFRWVAREDINIEISAEILFPRGYSIAKPTSEYLAHELVAAQLRGDKRNFFRAPEYATKLVESLIHQKISGSSFITLTTRELTRGDTKGLREIKVDIWQEVFKKLEASNITPIVIRDTAAAYSAPLFKNVIELPEVSIHLPLRMALYEKAILNFAKTNGPACLHFYGNTNAVVFNQVDNDFNPLSENWFANHHGHWGNGQFPMTSKSMRMVWEEESPELILHEIKSRTNNPAKQALLHEISDKKNIEASCAVAIRHLMNNLSSGLLKEDVDLFTALEKINQKIKFYPNLANLLIKHVDAGPGVENFNLLLSAAKYK